ncbi:hypothetical protein PRIPAC_75707 [Pristionchus pacificus]|uniref:Uncharacterized protein n=1 Tax=Pristionchus pacificus TaxID=54126 RepID=A0A2A6CAN8_PRIPA|nr:hypothetical protein PRIPAC_75707 [Pristionchus pacificus]|eukprot:PDM75187.1 hypothetical protein PRIPAC_40568 [Pristionchus pacificus]
MSSSSLTFLFVSFALLNGVAALTCYENDDKGHIVERTNENWKYCSLIPMADGDSGRLTGVGELTENLVGQDAVFGQNSKLYKVTVMCIYERYDFGAISHAFGPAPEYMFRCFCNTDRCNQHTTFSKFLKDSRY